MRISVQLKDGRILKTGSRSRYVAFRLTQFGSFSVHSNNQAEGVLKRVVDDHNRMGFKYVVLDTQNGEIIGHYPKTMNVALVGS